jgi:hypothetical protein
LNAIDSTPTTATAIDMITDTKNRKLNKRL